MQETRPVHPASELTFTCHGVTVGVQADDPAAIPRVAERLPPGSRLSLAAPRVRYSLRVGAAGEPHQLCRGGESLERAATLDALLDAFESRLHFDVATRAPRRLFVHAGVVGVGGRALVLPGRSWSGKTTLVAALVRAGAVYYSDEYAVLDARGRIHPYPKALSLRGPGADDRRLVPVEEMGGEAGREPWPVGLVAAVAHSPGARWAPCALTRGEALLALLGNTVLARVRPGFAIRMLGSAVRGAPAVGGLRGEAEEAAAALLEMMSRT